MFQFKQFSVDQTNCAMKINTDGVLLGALAGTDLPENILDIGTGTGVIALMLAQRFGDAKIDAVEIDELAAFTAGHNFGQSVFSKRLTIYPSGFEAFFETYAGKKYDLIVTNPPFYINLLHSPQQKKQIAKHADLKFFELMLQRVAQHLSAQGSCWMILPNSTAELVKSLASGYGLNNICSYNVRSFCDKKPHREIVVLSGRNDTFVEYDFVIYETEGVHSQQYRDALKNFFTIF